MTKESIYYNRMFGWKRISYDLSTKTIKTCNKEIITHYYVTFDNETLEIDKKEYDCLLKELKKECLKN